MEENMDLNALHKISYGLYVVTARDGDKDNGMIVNTVLQVTSDPVRIAVTINKQNYTHGIIQKTGVLNINCLDTSAPFPVFQNYGFQTGRTVDKFAGVDILRSKNGLRILPGHINAWMSLKVTGYTDLGTHGMFICDLTESKVVPGGETMTYGYYHQNVKPKPQTEQKKGYVCKICGWVYQGDPLPEGFVCPVCKHGAEDFEPLA